jgi:hypothetical protein
MRKPNAISMLFATLAISSSTAIASPALLETHCSKCHNDDDLKGDFSLRHLGEGLNNENFYLWEDSLDFVNTNEMPPPEKSELSEADREKLVLFLTQKVKDYHEDDSEPHRSSPRRLNNRELANSVADVLLISNVGTHQPVANLLGDTLEDGFDTNPDALGLSRYHLEQYIVSLRRILDATLFEGPRPQSKTYNVSVDNLEVVDFSQSRRSQRDNRTEESIDILGTRVRALFNNFEQVPTTGHYNIKIRAAGIDRGIYKADQTGMYPDDPIQLGVHFGDQIHTIDLEDNEPMVIEFNEWLAKGTHINLSHETDGLRMKGNGNFKFQYRIAHDYIKENDRKLYQYVLEEEVPIANRLQDRPDHWYHWTTYWQGPRPRVFSAEIEGPHYESWPPKRQIALLGVEPSVSQAEEILRPIAERAWRRELREGDLDPIIELVKSSEKTLGTIGAFKEGIVTILVSPSFLIINSTDGTPADRFASKFSYFLKGTTPDEHTLMAARNGNLASYQDVKNEVRRHFRNDEANEFLKEFPQAWLQLDRINFMAPDPERFPLYDRKRISQDMVNEAVAFFEHAIAENIPIPEFLSADYSFINADLAQVYGVEGVPQDSKLRKYTFEDGRRGGLLGMGAFLTLTADSLGTSPIHRAIYVMENLLGIHPNPPPPDVDIQEPDVRQAKTIKEILAAHTADETCASCHRAIDPYGYAFENFDPMGAWRDMYTMQIAKRPSNRELAEIAAEDKRLAALGLPPVPKPWENKPIPIDSSEKFRNGTEYSGIIEYRALMASEANRDRFVRCFISKLLTYANGEEPKNYWELEKILAESAKHNYRIVDTIAAVIHSPLFREE